MPFEPLYLTPEMVDAIYLSALQEIEAEELRSWIRRLADPASKDNPTFWEEARRRIAFDWVETKNAREKHHVVSQELSGSDGRQPAVSAQPVR